MPRSVPTGIRPLVRARLRDVQIYLVAEIHHISWSSWGSDLVSASNWYLNCNCYTHSRVCLQMAVTLDPALTGIILSEGFVGFGGPLHAIFLELTSVCGYDE